MRVKFEWKGFRYTCEVSDLNLICVECGSSFHAQKEDLFEMDFSENEEFHDLRYMKNKLRIKRPKTQEELENIRGQCSTCGRETNMKLVPFIIPYMTEGDKKRRLEILNSPTQDKEVKKWIRQWIRL